MTEFWIEVNIIPMKKNVEDILLMAVKPIVDQFQGQVESWHFLRESTPIGKLHIRFRMRTQQAAQLGAIRTKIEAVLTPLKGNEIEDFYYGNHGTPETPTNKYEGEEKDFGVKGWQITQKMMERTSSAVIEMIIKSPLEKPVDWYAERTIHFFINQIGFNRYDEASLHHLWSIGNLLIALGVRQELDQFQTLKEKYYERYPADIQH